MLDSKRQAEQLFTIDEVAQIFNVTPRTIYRWLTEGKLSGKKIGRGWRISQASISELTKTRSRELETETTRSLIRRGHYLALAPERSVLAGVVLKLIELGLQQDFNVFCGCWTQTIQEQYDLAHKMGIPLDRLEKEGRFFAVDFARDFARSRANGILDNWQNWAEVSRKSDRPIMGIGTPNIHGWGNRPEDIVDFEAGLDDLWRSVQAVSFCVYSLADFVPEGLQRLGSLISHHDGLIMWGENGSIVLERSIPLSSIFGARSVPTT